LKEHSSHDLANKYFSSGYGSIITFGIKGGLEAGKTLINNIELWSHVANVGDAKSLIIHPASTTHQQLSPEALEQSGVPEELVRLAIGIEDIDNILQTLDAGLEKATGIKTIDTTTENAIEWLLSSPFDRTDGLHQKTIAVSGSDELANKVTTLATYGYKIVSLTDTEEEAIDAVVTDKQISIDACKDAKIIWNEKHTSEIERNKAGIVKGKDIITESNHIRQKDIKYIVYLFHHLVIKIT